MKNTTEKLLEPVGSRACRRNILALAGIVVLVGLAGADPHELSVFGVEPSGSRGVLVLGVAVILVQLYWYVLKYHHLKEDGVIEQVLSAPGAERLKIRNEFTLVQRDADLFSNRVAAVLTVWSWYFVVSWIIDGVSQ